MDEDGSVSMLMVVLATFGTTVLLGVAAMCTVKLVQRQRQRKDPPPLEAPPEHADEQRTATQAGWPDLVEPREDELAKDDDDASNPRSNVSAAEPAPLHEQTSVFEEQRREAMEHTKSAGKKSAPGRETERKNSVATAAAAAATTTTKTTDVPDMVKPGEGELLKTWEFEDGLAQKHLDPSTLPQPGPTMVMM